MTPEVDDPILDAIRESVACPSLIAAEATVDAWAEHLAYISRPDEPAAQRFFAGANARYIARGELVLAAWQRRVDELREEATHAV